MLNSGCTLGSALLNLQAQGVKMAAEKGAINVLGQDIACVLSPWNLLKGEVSCTHSILHPKVGGREVAKFAQPAPPTDAYGRCGISLYSQRPVQAKVASHRDETKRVARAFTYAAEFCLT